jgi:gliding motility-associated-like protein
LSIIPTRDVTYTLEVTDECRETVSAEITIDLVEVEADFEFDYDSDHRPVRNLSVFGLAYFWTLPDGQTSTAFEPDFVPLAGENQLVGLEVTHPAGCTDQVVKFYDPPLNVFIPNAFTPDGDGLNDIFKAEGTFIKTFDLWIFDRWGNVVFHSKDPDIGWDGSDSSDDFSGQSLIYSYRLRAEGYSGEVLDKKGSVQVLR